MRILEVFAADMRAKNLGPLSRRSLEGPVQLISKHSIIGLPVVDEAFALIIGEA